MKTKHPPQVKLPTLPSFEKKLSWVWVDSGDFPIEKLGAPELASYSPKLLIEFENAILAVQDRIWILDPHFNVQFGLSAIWLALCASEAKDIRVISHNQRPTDWIENAVKSMGYKPPAPIDWRVCFFSLHDRFALLDNELWHFGSTVGGAYPGFGAATRGWAADHLSRIFSSQWER